MPRSKRNPELAKLIGARIRALRLAAGLTQEALAWDCDLDKGYLSHVEAGRRLPSLVVVFELAKRLGCTVGTLLDLQVEPAKSASASRSDPPIGDR
jgi:transcriptional regulator with XRE-family HTH domain